MKRITTLVVMTLLAAPAMLAAQQDDPIQDAFDRVAEAGVPTSLLESLQAEGKARGVPADVLADAMQRRADALVRAQEAMSQRGPDASEPELAAGADAIQAGVSEAVLSALAENSAEAGGQRVAAIAALGVLVEMGHVPAEALARVQEALQRGPDALAGLHGRAMQERAHHGPPASAFDRAPLGVPARGAADSRPTPPRGPRGGGL